MQLNDIIQKFNNVKPNGTGYICECPVCKDDHHLYLSQKDSKVLMYCQKCGAGFKDIIPLLDLPKPGNKSPPAEQYDHIYKNPDGSIAYYKTRTKYFDGKKKFTFWHNKNGEKVYKKPDNCNCLYNLDILQNADKNAPLYIVEGEKCADIMIKHGFVTTTSNTGGGNDKIKFSRTDVDMLNSFANKIIIPDNDETGYKYAGKFSDVKILYLTDIWQDIKPKDDIYDYIAKGKDLDLIRNYSFTDMPRGNTGVNEDDVFTGGKIMFGGKPFGELTAGELISAELFEMLENIKDSFERSQAVAMCRNRARDLKMANDFNRSHKQYKISSAKKESSGSSYNGNYTQFTSQPVELRCGEWNCNDRGVKINEITQSGNISVKLCSPIPVMPTEIITNISTGVEKIRIAFNKSGWRNIICERSVTASSTKIIDLANNGIEVNSENAKLLVKYIAAMVRYNLNILPQIRSSSRLGWVGANEFMPYCSGISFDGEKENKYLFEAVRQKGSLEAWIAYMRPLRENIYFRLMMAASFASPLIEKVNALPFVFHLWGLTGSGKTVALMAAMSIWGDPGMGKMTRTMNMTANSMLSTAAFLNNLPFGGDELQTIKSRWDNYDNLIMKITEGIDRGRMTYDRNNELRAWKCSFLFTGEEPCTKSSSGGGVKNRVIEIECTGEIVSNGNAAVNFIGGNYGSAGVEYISFVKKYQDGLLPRYNEICGEVMKEADTTEKQAMAISLVLLADRISCSCLFKGGKPLEVSDVKDFLASSAEVDPSERAYDFVINLCAKNANRFNLSGENTGEIWGKAENDSILINKDILCKELSKEGFEFEALKSKWLDKGYLLKNSTGRFMHQTRCHGIKANYVKLRQKNDDAEAEVEKIPFCD